MGDAILCLDIDGVINTDASCRAVDPGVLLVDPAAVFDCAKRSLVPDLARRVQSICDRTGAHILIVSGWRMWLSVGQITEALRSVGITAPVVGAVPRKMSGDCRALTTAGWLRQHPEVARYVILDDTAQHWTSGGCTADGIDPKRLVHPVDGISEADVERAVAILGELPMGAMGCVEVSDG